MSVPYVPVKIVAGSSFSVKTVPPAVGVFVFAVGFVGLWGNRGFLRAASITLSTICTWLVMWLWRATTFAYWRISPKASEELKAVRNKYCNDCEALERDGNRRFCGACGCPRTKYSELTKKNGREGHNCPLGIHPGSVKLARGPCSGPGCGKKKTVASTDYTI